eukprot:1082125-Pleurochrysis_carterae.AAC.1
MSAGRAEKCLPAEAESPGPWCPSRPCPTERQCTCIDSTRRVNAQPGVPQEKRAAEGDRKRARDHALGEGVDESKASSSWQDTRTKLRALKPEKAGHDAGRAGECTHNRRNGNST